MTTETTDEPVGSSPPFPTLPDDLLPPTHPRGQHRLVSNDERRPVYCPFDADGDCPADCPSLTERSCINGE